jgi:hypothetical protein
VPYITSIERRAIERGLAQGLHQGAVTEARLSLPDALEYRMGVVPSH